MNDRIAAYLSDEQLGPVVRSISAVAIIRISGGFLLYLTQILLARWMGIEAFGVYSFAIVWCWTLSVFSALGWQGSSVRFISQYLATGAKAKLIGFLRFASKIPLASGLLVFLMYCLLYWFSNDTINANYRTPLLVATLGVPINAFFIVQCAFARSFRRMPLATAAEQMLRPIVLISIAAFFTLTVPHTPVELFIAASIGSYVVAGILLLISLRRGLERSVKSAPAEREVGRWFKTSWPFFITSGSYVVLDNSSIFLVGLLMDPADTALLTAAIRTATLVAFINLTADAVLQPEISALHTQGKYDQLQPLVVRVSRLSFGFTAALSLFLIVFGEFVLAFFGLSFTEAYLPMIILVCGFCIVTAFGPLTGLLNMTGHQNITAIGFCVAAGSGIALCLLLIPLFGITGAAIAISGNLILLRCYLYLRIVQKLSIRPSIFSKLTVPPSSQQDKAL